jgi:hypothetical protein
MDKNRLKQLQDKKLNTKSAIKLRAYLVKLVESGYRLPSGDSREGVNKDFLAKSADLGRQVFYEGRGGKEVLSLFSWAVENIGVETISEQEDRALNSANTDVTVLQKIIKDKDRSISKLESDNLEMSAALSLANKKIHDLQELIEKRRSIDEIRIEGYEVVVWET